MEQTRFTADDVWAAVNTFKYYVRANVNQHCDQDDVLSEACLILLQRVRDRVVIRGLTNYAHGIIHNLICTHVEQLCSDRHGGNGSARISVNSTVTFAPGHLKYLNRDSTQVAYAESERVLLDKRRDPLAELLYVEEEARRSTMSDQTSMSAKQRSIIKEQMAGATAAQQTSRMGENVIRNARHRALGKLRAKAKQSLVNEELEMLCRRAIYG